MKASNRPTDAPASPHRGSVPTLQQLRYLREIARHCFSISKAAAALDASQPGVSRQIQALERALGVRLLIRRSNRLLGFTEVGLQVLELATRIINDTENVRAVAAEARDEHRGKLRVATTHLHARYSLPAVIKRFSDEHPGIDFQLLQVDWNRIADLVESGEAELGISTDSPGDSHALVLLEGDVISRSLIVPAGHALAGRTGFTLKDLAGYPFLGYNPSSSSGRVIARAFHGARIEVRFVVSANDSDVIKAYVEAGLGIAVIPTIALGAGSEHRLCSADVTDLFAPSRMVVSLRRSAYPRRYVTDFVRMLTPRWDRAAVLDAIAGAKA
jgi:LysR family cys regulon transcriptional activator